MNSPFAMLHVPSHVWSSPTQYKHTLCKHHTPHTPQLRNLNSVGSLSPAPSCSDEWFMRHIKHHSRVHTPNPTHVPITMHTSFATSLAPMLVGNYWQGAHHAPTAPDFSVRLQRARHWFWNARSPAVTCSLQDSTLHFSWVSCAVAIMCTRNMRSSVSSDPDELRCGAHLTVYKVSDARKP